MIYNIITCIFSDSVLLFAFLSILSLTKLITNIMDIIQGKEKNYDLLIVCSFLLIFSTKHLITNVLKYNTKMCQVYQNKLETNNKINNKNINTKSINTKK